MTSTLLHGTAGTVPRSVFWRERPINGVTNSPAKDHETGQDQRDALLAESGQITSITTLPELWSRICMLMRSTTCPSGSDIDVIMIYKLIS
jgi:hypothetical protein